MEETHNLFYLKYLSILAFISLLVMSYIQPLKVLSNELDAVKNDNITEKDYDKFVGIHRSYLIVRLALLEGAGLFGLVIFL
ncbi:MAG: hypothetical protein H6609_20595 [Ignavibacteriales bacterium]|nr:hypothetical protein [Ignavibacteriales bacterium]